MKDKKLALFLELGGSLKLWEGIGFIDREANIYNKFARNFKAVYIFTYGNKADLKYSKYFAENIMIFPKKYAVPNFLYEILMPFFYFRKIREADIYKTNQNSGSLSPTMAKLFNPEAKLVIRSGFIGSDFAKLTNFPVLAKIYFTAVEYISYHLCDKAFTPTKSYFESLLRKYPFLKDKLVLLGNSIDTGLFAPKILSKNYDIIYVARLNAKQKNHFLLLRAVLDTNLKVLLIGQGEEKNKITAFCAENGINLKIIEKVPNNELPDYYNSAKICVFPSLHEGNPKTLLEAMACGLPAIGLSVPGVENIISNNQNGVISANDPADFREKIELLLGDNNLYEKISINARKFVLENYSLDKLLNKEIEVYEKLF